ncbi:MULTISPECIES: AarF/ABC1/UbiB kinase family protein [unclassified Microcystis]|jgi:predicted unusual protein kinase regulating ubiquinone biosynthesis (AarF/ABC1/UbiB family)|uniref:AarF/ABC1/UbiB kinase family protein n=3 Tax=Microcystis TaxID=1125 RepID=A0A552KTU0_9CHRO|nr:MULTISPECIES: AarF/ABC1/UbiB kinase family protein [unclassified Microcystis]MCA2815583.1 AarF/ABC1/UbiB kinase family protein [Microcystis sp. M085S1]MCA2853573.1 AarF/ABC1/UbiB kinase family protein [Microcystis sp. M065S1]TRT81435.1 MAG: AarF/ABC1/UbiB kinase family protein [Microcystis flos-aquae Ma_QC_C_20070823_S18]TRT97195.1 MAG: AarF/ABC1/UbiB kinase family protein [Microcystis flos-aquae Ma_QC_C_20070823_S18D]TRV11351.1 MAG: AarF/ABC1/UbiB kinase family protein [Microcystis flos-aq
MLTPFDSPKSLHWQQSLRSPIIRQLEIFSFTMQFLTFLLWDRLTGANRGKKRQRRAKWLVDRLMNLGPTFIKIGQSLSTRADLIPLEYIEQLTQLQDRVPEFNSQEAIRVIETELGQPLDNLFASFSVSPLACASLGQVHRARLLSGEEVVIKVQRPNLEGLFNLDFEVLHRLTRWLNIFSVVKKYNLEAIYQEFFELLFQEIDYIHEGKNADRFRENFKNYPQVKVPLVYWQYTTRKVLTLEYVPGIKVDDRETLIANGINVDGIIQLGICSYLKQLLQDGFFQSDPHPGNMAVSQEGELIFYDFGTMFELKSVAKDQMIETFFAILRKDTETVLKTLVYMGLIEPVRDLQPVRNILQFLLDEFRDKPVDVRVFEQISDQVYLMFKQQPFRLPPQMTFIIKSVTTLDGIARSLDPQYNLLAASQPFVKSLAVSGGTTNTMLTLANQARTFLKQQWQKGNKNERMIRQLEEKIERGNLVFQVKSRENERLLKRIYLGIKLLINVCLLGFSIISAIFLLDTNYSKLAIIPFSLAGLFALFFLRSSLALLIQERLDKMLDK